MTARLSIVAVAVLAILAVLAVTVPMMAGAATGPQKKLFASRWYQEPNGDYRTWMTLKTSQFYFDCETSETKCFNKWYGPGLTAIIDWSVQGTTVDFDQLDDQNIYYDVNVFIEDLVLGDPAIQGLALPLDENGDPCLVEDCTIWFGEVFIGDIGHFGDYARTNVRRVTIAHELGHLIGLRHESVSTDGTELFPCGMDDTGLIPFSIMAYGCIIPVGAGGQGLYKVQPWDVCGVNVAYPDPKYPNADCPEPAPPTPTPSPSPTPAPLKQGDANCNGGVDVSDIGILLQIGIGLPAPCADYQNNVNCSGATDAMDALAVAIYLSQLDPLPVASNCTPIGEPLLEG